MLVYTQISYCHCTRFYLFGASRLELYLIQYLKTGMSKRWQGDPPRCCRWKRCSHCCCLHAKPFFAWDLSGWPVPCFFLPNCISRRSSPRFVAGEVGAAKWSAGNSASEETEGIASALSESGSGLAPVLSDGFGGSNLDQRSTSEWSTQFYAFRF